MQSSRGCEALKPFACPPVKLRRRIDSGLHDGQSFRQKGYTWPVFIGRKANISWRVCRLPCGFEVHRALSKTVRLSSTHAWLFACLAACLQSSLSRSRHAWPDAWTVGRLYAAPEANAHAARHGLAKAWMDRFGRRSYLSNAHLTSLTMRHTIVIIHVLQ